jgi:hypothetical protein
MQENETMVPPFVDILEKATLQKGEIHLNGGHNEFFEPYKQPVTVDYSKLPTDSDRLGESIYMLWQQLLTYPTSALSFLESAATYHFDRGIKDAAWAAKKLDLAAKALADGLVLKESCSAFLAQPAVKENIVKTSKRDQDFHDSLKAEIVNFDKGTEPKDMISLINEYRRLSKQLKQESE